MEQTSQPSQLKHVNTRPVPDTRVVGWGTSLIRSVQKSPRWIAARHSDAEPEGEALQGENIFQSQEKKHLLTLK